MDHASRPLLQDLEAVKAYQAGANVGFAESMMRIIKKSPAASPGRSGAKESREWLYVLEFPAWCGFRCARWLHAALCVTADVSVVCVIISLCSMSLFPCHSALVPLHSALANHALLFNCPHDWTGSLTNKRAQDVAL